MTTGPTRYDTSERTTWYDEEVTHLQRWASDDSYVLEPGRAQVKVGTSRSCDWQLHDDSGRLSRAHAVFTPSGNTWQVKDLGSTNGIKLDGLRVPSDTLQPGVRIKLGGVLLIAETASFRALRTLVRRLLGWAPERQRIVEETLQSLRDFATLRVPLMLFGYGDLLPTAALLHRATLAPRIPIYTRGKGSLTAAIDAAMDGTLCVPSSSYATMTAIASLVRNRTVGSPRLIFCKKKKADAETTLVPEQLGHFGAITIPTLSTRRDEIPRICAELIPDILRWQGFESHGLYPAELERIRNMPPMHVTDLEDTLQRLIAIRNVGVFQAGRLLDLSHSTLSEWSTNWTRSANRASTSNLDRG